MFPPNPIRDVEARYVKVGACGAFAIAIVDFEPAWPGSARFELAIPGDLRLDLGGIDDQDYRFVFECVHALADGITEEFEARPDLDVRTKVVLRRIVINPIDSNSPSFRQAGRIAARAALERTTDDARA